jgi:hypothetical protein
LKTQILEQCAALHALSNNKNLTALAFKTAELSNTEYIMTIFKFFHTLSTFETGNRNEDGVIFFIWFGVPDY